MKEKSVLLMLFAVIISATAFPAFSQESKKQDHPAIWESLNAEAVKAYNQGRYREGIKAAEKACEYAKKHLGKEHPDTLISINNLAELYKSQGRYADAEPLYLEVLQIKEKVLDKEHPSTLTSITNLAGLYKSRGSYADAESLYRETLQLSEKILGKEHPSTLTSINNLAGLYKSRGRYADAEPLFLEAMQLSEKLTGENHPHTLVFQSNYIILMVNPERYRTAFRLMKQMESRLLSRSFQELYSTSEDRIRRLFLKNISEFQDMVFSFVLKYPESGHSRYAAEIALRWKQVYAEEFAFQHRLLCASGDPDVRKLRKDISRFRTEFSQKIRHPEKGREFSDIISDLRTAEKKMREKARDTKPELLVSSADSDRVMDSLPKNSALIEFRRFNPLDFKTGDYDRTNWGAYLLLSDIEAEQQAFFENLGTFEDLDEILKNADDPSTGLYKMFIAKFEDRLKGVKTLFIAPDGFLNQISFARLKSPDAKYLVQRFQINRLQTGRDLAVPAVKKTSATLVALGGVEYGGDAKPAKTGANSEDAGKTLKTFNPNLRAARDLDRFEYLKHSLDEAEKIAKLFEAHRKNGSAKLYKGGEASENLLKSMKAPPEILHLSTHGFYLEKAEDSQLGEAEPMVLSGLALSGANRGLKGMVDEHGDDGLLYSLEALGLNLQGTRLVSLSACETGKGVTDYSEGVYGLVRAFRRGAVRAHDADEGRRQGVQGVHGGILLPVAVRARRHAPGGRAARNAASFHRAQESGFAGAGVLVALCSCGRDMTTRRSTGTSPITFPGSTDLQVGARTGLEAGSPRRPATNGEHRVNPCF